MAETFTAEVGAEDEGIFIEVPSHVLARLGPRKRPPVVVTVKGHSFRSTPAIYGGRAYVPLRREVREKAGITAGEEVSVTLELDSRPRTVEPPADLEAALSSAPEARATFDRLSFTSRKEYVDWITQARREQTRVQRVQRAVELLRDGVREPR